MNNIIIGITRALLYYRYQDLWLNFFKNLNIKTIVSPKTNKKIIEKGSSYVVDEACLSLKIFMGHIDYLKDKCDYIFIPRIACLKENEKVCTNFLSIYDLVKNTFPNLKILNFNVDYEQNLQEADGFKKIGTDLNLNLVQVMKAYEKAKQEKKLISSQKENKLKRSLQDKNIKIMVVSHPYNLHDEFIGKPIINYLKKENITPILTDDASNKKIDTKGLSNTLYWTFNNELMSFIKKYKDGVDGIILLSTFPCGPDSLANELILRRIKNIPICFITVDNNSSDTGLITRLESFIDIIKLKKRRQDNERTYN